VRNTEGETAAWRSFHLLFLTQALIVAGNATPAHPHKLMRIVLAFDHALGVTVILQSRILPALATFQI